MTPAQRRSLLRVFVAHADELATRQMPALDPEGLAARVIDDFKTSIQLEPDGPELARELAAILRERIGHSTRSSADTPSG